MSPASVMPSWLTSTGAAACFSSDRLAGLAVLVMVQLTKSPMPRVTVADGPAAPDGKEGSAAPLRVQDHERAVVGQEARRGRLREGVALARCARSAR